MATHRFIGIILLAAMLALSPAADLCLAAYCSETGPKTGPSDRASSVQTARVESLRLAIGDLIETFGSKYPRGPRYLARLEALANAANTGKASVGRELESLRQEALLDNPLLDFDRLVLLKRKRGQLGLPVNHKCNSGIKQTGYDNEIAVLEPVQPSGRLQTLYRPEGSAYVGEIDLHFDADRLLFTMPGGKTWQIHEIRTDGSGLRQVSRGEHQDALLQDVLLQDVLLQDVLLQDVLLQDVDNFDACYLPGGRIVFASTASYHAVPCWHGKERACNIYRMDADGRNVRQLCFDQDLDLHPSVLPNGQVIFSRWDYTGPMHIYLRPLMVMNPDGTGQRAAYGSNSYWPNALYYPRGIPGSAEKIVAIVAGYHGVPRMGELALLDLTKGWHEADGVVQRIPGRGKPVVPIIRDNLVDRSWPKFLHPYPLSDKYFLVAAQLDGKSPWGIYLVDVFDNVLPICVLDRFDLFEPIPLRKTPRPPVVPDRVDYGRRDAVVYLHDVYAGPGLAGVPRGTIRRLRVVAYHFGYPGLAGPDKIGSGGPWEVMRILGTVPVDKDGSAAFRVPASTPLSVQPLDAEGKAVQLMRSWFTAMPGETVSCVGCHEQPRDTPLVRYELAATRAPVEITPWHGPARGFDFQREVQPVLDEYCVGCHDGRRSRRKGARGDGSRICDLRSEQLVDGYRGRPLTKLGANRLHPATREAFAGASVRYTPAYEALVPYIRRVNVEDHVGLLVPGEYHADTSELIQMLRDGHHHVQLDAEAWDRLITWIDLNGPCHGSWGDVCPVPDGADRRRRELWRLYGGPSEDPEKVAEIPRPPVTPIVPQQPAETRPEVPKLAGWPLDAEEARRRQEATGVVGKTVDLGGGVTMRLVRIPAGEFVIGGYDGEINERPPGRVSIPSHFWISACEVTNEQFHRFDPSHDSGLFAKRFQGPDGPGLSLGGPRQPVVRVSWKQATAFCRWLCSRGDGGSRGDRARRAGLEFRLPTEAQWEYAARAGSAAPLCYGMIETDFSPWANVADKSLSVHPGPTGGLESNLTAHFGKAIFQSAVFGGNIVCDVRFDDRTVATAEVGSYGPNAWGLHDVHGNVAEWTRTTYHPYPYRDNTDSKNLSSDVRGNTQKKVVRGGSWVDRPRRCRSGFRLSYPAWQRVFNVGFRVVVQERI